MFKILKPYSHVEVEVVVNQGVKMGQKVNPKGFRLGKNGQYYNSAHRF